MADEDKKPEPEVEPTPELTETAAVEAEESVTSSPEGSDAIAASADADAAATETPAEVAEETVVEEPVVEEPVAAKPKRASRRKAPAPVEEVVVPEPAAKRGRAGARDEETAQVVRAQAKYVRTSARKARLVCDHIRGKSVDEARAILAFTPRAAAKDWAKLLNSAVANAENNHELLGSDLKVATVYADEGPTLKRFQPRAMGRATRIRKRTSHLTITLTPKG
jgi:ribosomal protein L22